MVMRDYQPVAVEAQQVASGILAVSRGQRVDRQTAVPARFMLPASANTRLSQPQCAITGSHRNRRRVHNRDRHQVLRRHWDHQGFDPSRRQARRRQSDHPECCRRRR
jgi:hypothetical protein